MEQSNIFRQERIFNALNELGIPASVIGRECLEEAIMEVMDDPKLMRDVTGRLYPKVASAVGTTASRAERAIRHAIELSAQNCFDDPYAKLFGNSIAPDKLRPTNSQFIAMLAKKILLDEAKATVA